MLRMVVLAAVVGLVAGSSPPVVAQDEELRMGDDPAYLERIEVPEAGVALSFPPDWNVTVEMAYGQYRPGDPYSGYWDVLSGSDDEADHRCNLDWEMYPGPSMLELTGLGEELDELGAELDAGTSLLSLADVSEVEIPAGTAVRMVMDSPVSDDQMVTYSIDPDGTRLSLTCFGERLPADEWLGIFETLELLPSDARLELPLDPSTDSGVTLNAQRYELERVELPEIGLAMQLPLDWDLEVMAEARELELPPNELDDGPMSFLQAFYMQGPFDEWCSLQIHRESTLDVSEHSDLQEAIWTAEAAAHMHAVSMYDYIADGLARRVDFISETNSGVARAHIIDVDGARHVLTCGSSIGVSPSWRDMAGSIEPLGDTVASPPMPGTSEGTDDAGAADIPEDAVAWDSVGPYTTVVPITEAEAMTADCSRATWIEYADGTFEERIECVLSYDPVGPDYDQAIWPLTDVQLEGGPCEWYSDFWKETDGSKVWAESWEISAQTSGHVSGTSRYGAEAIECEDEVATLGQRHELADAGMALRLPADWEIRPETGSVGPGYLPDGPGTIAVDMWRALRASPGDGVWCSVFMYDGSLRSLEDHG